MDRKELEALGLSAENARAVAEMGRRETEALSQDYEARLLRLGVNAQLSLDGARDPRTVLPLIDMARVRWEDGQVSGLSEQIKEIRRNAPYLFAADQAPQSSGCDHGAPPGPAAPATLRDALSQRYPG